MSAPATLTRTHVDVGKDDDIVHITCCDDDLALCGTDVSDCDDSDDDETCVVCVDLANAPCSAGCDW